MDPPAGSQPSELTGAERRCMQECKLEAFWRRSLPLTIICGSSVLLAVHKKKIKPNGVLGPWPKTLVAAGIGFWAGKLSYLLSGSCLDKFLKYEPDGLIAYTVRQNRKLPQPESITPEKARHYERLLDEDTDEELLDVGSLDLDPRGEQILDSCDETAVLEWGLPGAAVFSAFAVHAQKYGYLRDFSSVVRFPWSRVPWVLFAFVIGNHVGQEMYTRYSNDCYQRFLSGQPRGLAAREVRTYFGLNPEATCMHDYPPPKSSSQVPEEPAATQKRLSPDGDYELSDEGFFLPVRSRVKYSVLGADELILQDAYIASSRSWNEAWVKGDAAVKGSREKVFDLKCET